MRGYSFGVGGLFKGTPNGEGKKVEIFLIRKGGNFLLQGEATFMVGRK